jgi:hypothetical protein
MLLGRIAGSPLVDGTSASDAHVTLGRRMARKKILQVYATQQPKNSLYLSLTTARMFAVRVVDATKYLRIIREFLAA